MALLAISCEDAPGKCFWCAWAGPGWDDISGALGLDALGFGCQTLRVFSTNDLHDMC